MRLSPELRLAFLTVRTDDKLACLLQLLRDVVDPHFERDVERGRLRATNRLDDFEVAQLSTEPFDFDADGTGSE